VLRPRLIALALLIGFAAPAMAAEDARVTAARTVVRKTVDDVLAVLKHQDWPSEQRIDAIEEIAFGVFDFETVSRLVLAQNYQRFTPEQRVEFVDAFKTHLSHSYGSRIDRYEQQQVEITHARLESRGDVTVLTRIVGGEADGIEMNYRLRAQSSDWKVIDVVIEGVSLVSNFRTQFKEVVSQGGAELLLKKLRDKNTRFEPPPKQPT
jgi:phospholipid transport system substrate-binding protein